MNIRPWFWIIAGVGATVAGGYWGGGQVLPISGKSQQTVPAKAPVLVETSIKPNFVYAAENPLLRSPWSVENRESSPPFSVEEEQQDSAIPEPSLQLTSIPPDWIMNPSGQMIPPGEMQPGMIQPETPVDPNEISADVQQVLAPPPPFPVEEEQQDSAIPDPSLQLSSIPTDWVMNPSGQLIPPGEMQLGMIPPEMSPPEAPQ
ncbi:MAG: hypothetical protein WA635_07795 [Gallionella sp.]